MIKQFIKPYTLSVQELAERKNAFELIFLYYLHSAYHYNRGYFYSFAKMNLLLSGGTIIDILLCASAFAFFGTLLQLDKFSLLYEVIFFH